MRAAGICAAGRWRLRSDAATLLTLVTSTSAPLPVRAHALARARRLLAAWQLRARTRQLVHGDAGHDGGAGMPAALRRRISQRLDAWLVEVPLAERAASSARVVRLRAATAALHGVGAVATATAALRMSEMGDFVAALERLVLHAPSDERVRADRLSALLLLHRPAPAAPAPPAPSTGTAAPR